MRYALHRTRSAGPHPRKRAKRAHPDKAWAPPARAKRVRATGPRAPSRGHHDTYTANGQLLTKTGPEGTTTYAYDAQGSLVAAELPDGRLVEYVTDGKARRVAKKVDGVTVRQWLYRDPLAPMAELDGAGALVAQYVYGTKPNVPDLVIRGGQTYRVVSDQLGSPVLAVNVADSGDVPFRAEYAAFGYVSGQGLEWMALGFAGGLYDLDTGLVRFGARDYEPTLGRWVSKEPIRFRGGRNFYVYAWDDPVNWFDRTGLQPEPTGGSAGAPADPGGGVEGTSGTGEPLPGPSDRRTYCGSGWNEPFVPDGFGYVDWSGACREHDECHANCDADKAWCDASLDYDITMKCTWCGPVGSVNGAAVDWLGDSAYDNAHAAYCACH